MSDGSRAEESTSSEATSNLDKPLLDPDVLAAHNRFGYRLFADLLSDATNESGNVILSPISVALALAMTENGASDETALAIAQAMQHAELMDGGLTQKALNASNLALINLLNEAAAEGDIRLKVANALWHRNGLTLVPEFADATEHFYRAELSGLDFSAAESVDRVNAWADEATEGLIPSVVDELSDDLAVLIANAVYFKGDWQTPFDSRLTRPLPFRLTTGERPEVAMMYRSGSIEYFEEDFQAIRLPYGEAGRTAMYVFLPPENESIATFAERLQDAAADAFGNFRSLEGEVWLPRLDVSFKSSLNEPLKRLGMGIAFDPGAADFSRMVLGARPGDLFIGNVLHQAVLKLDETGTEAAAVTSIEIRLTSVPVRRFAFRADRPFLFVIRDDETGAILFTGAIVDPRGA